MCILPFQIRYRSYPGATPLSRYRKRAHFGKISYSFSLKFYTNLQSPVARLKLGPWRKNDFFHDPLVGPQVLSWHSPFLDEKTEILPTLVIDCPPSMLFLSIYIVISYQWVISLVLYTWFRLIVRLILDLRLRRRRSHRMTSVVVNSYQFFSLYGLSWFLAFPYCKGKKRVFSQDEIQAHLHFSPFL